MSLRDKIIKHCMGTPVVCTKIIKEVKEFIKKLEGSCNRHGFIHIDQIKEEAGKELTEIKGCGVLIPIDPSDKNSEGWICGQYYPAVKSKIFCDKCKEIIRQKEETKTMEQDEEGYVEVKPEQEVESDVEQDVEEENDLGIEMPKLEMPEMKMPNLDLGL